MSVHVNYKLKMSIEKINKMMNEVEYKPVIPIIFLCLSYIILEMNNVVIEYIKSIQI